LSAKLRLTEKISAKIRIILNRPSIKTRLTYCFITHIAVVIMGQYWCHSQKSSSLCNCHARNKDNKVSRLGRSTACH